MKIRHGVLSVIIVACAIGALLLYLRKPTSNELANGVYRTTIPYRVLEGEGEIDVVRIVPGSGKFSVEHDEGNPHTINEWGALKENSIVINGGYFHDDYSPSGFLVSNGQRIGDRMFDADKSGFVFMTSGTATLRDLETHPLSPLELYDHAIQSYPFLIKNHKLAIATDSGKRARRTAIATDDGGAIYLLIAQMPDLSLYEFMNILKKSPYHFSYVLNLDGGPSTGMAIQIDSYKQTIHSQSHIPHIIRFVPGQI